MPSELLKAKEIDRLLSKRGKHRDGAGLFLQVAAKGQASWVYQYRFDGETKWMSIGPAVTYTLEEARQRHHELRRLRDRGTDPRDGASVPALARVLAEPVPFTLAERETKLPARDGIKTFGDVVAEYIEAFRGDWVGGKNEKDIRRTLTGNAFAALAVDRIKPAEVVAFLKTLSPGIVEKAIFRIGSVMAFAIAKEYRTAANPAEMKTLKALGVRPQGTQEHFAAVPLAEMPELISDLRADGSTEARAVLFALATASRPDPVRLATWAQIDIANAVWIAPLENMKGRKGKRKEHRVPLAPSILKLLGEPGLPGEFVFPSRREGAAKAMWGGAMRDLMGKLKPGMTVHGTARATFSGDWALKAGYSEELRQMALAHVVGDKVQQTYNRPLPELYKERIPMMTAWAEFLKI